MAIDALVKPLLQLPLFRGLKPMQITEIVRRADRIVYRPGDVIIEEHAEADAAIVLVEGEAVRVSGPDLSGRAEPVQVGSLLAELGMLIETQHSSTIVARTAVNAMRIPRTEIHEMMAEDPAIADHFRAKDCRPVDQAGRRASQHRQHSGRLRGAFCARARGHGRRLPTLSLTPAFAPPRRGLRLLHAAGQRCAGLLPVSFLRLRHAGARARSETIAPSPTRGSHLPRGDPIAQLLASRKIAILTDCVRANRPRQQRQHDGAYPVTKARCDYGAQAAP